MHIRSGSKKRAGWMSMNMLAALGLAGGAVGLAIATGAMRSGSVVTASSEELVLAPSAFVPSTLSTCPGDNCVDPDGNCIPCPIDPPTDGPPSPGDPGDPGDPSRSVGNGIFRDKETNWLDKNKDRGSHPDLMSPVELSQLAKLENKIDLTVKLPGQNFNWARSYSSISTYTTTGLGFHWNSNAFFFVDEDTVNKKITVFGQNKEDVEFIDPSSPPTGIFRPRGIVTQEIRSVGQELYGYPGEGVTSVNVWTLTEPGKWEIDFYKSGTSGGNIPSDAVGRMLQYRDAYGNTRTYEYDTFVNNSSIAYLSKIYLNGTEGPGGTTDPSDAMIDLTWFDLSGATPPAHDMQVDRVEVVRKNGGATIVTQWVDYDYDTELTGFTPSADLGATPNSTDPALLVQVKQGVLVDNVPASLSHADYANGNYYVRFTQYRYHDDRTTPFDPLLDSDGLPREPQDATGDEGTLKLIITPEQIEFLAQELNKNATPVNPGDEPSGTIGFIGEAVYEAAEDLLQEDDGSDVGGSGYSPFDLASKIISYWSYDDQVSVQWLQADCGCGGGGSSSFKRMTYDILYFADAIPTGPGLPVADGTDEGKTVVVKEYAGTENDVYREYRYDMVYPRGFEGAPYLVAKALRDHDLYTGNMQTDNKWWVWWYDHNFETDGYTGNAYGRPGEVKDIYTPSAMATYTPATSTVAAAYTAVGSGGLVYRHEYNDKRRRIESSTGTLASSSLTLEPYVRLSYPGSDTTTTRMYLPSHIEKNQTGEGWSTIGVDDVELTEFAYNFADSTTMAMRRQEVKVEAELVAENGPGVQTYDSVVMYDDRGRVAWITAADGSMTYRGYDATTGAVTDIIQNADPLGTASSNPAFVPGDYGYGSTPSGWGTNGDGGELETSLDVDILGRWTKRTAPGGVETYMVREVSEESERPGVAYMSTLFMPHKLAGSSPVELSGPASRSWKNGKGQPIRSSSFSIDGTATYNVPNGDYTIDAELTRSTTVHDIHGQAINARRWHDIAETNFTGTDAYDESLMTYDSYGRLEQIEDAEGSITIYGYDALDRPISVSQSSDAVGATEVTIANAYYDNDSASQGIGNGNVGRIDYSTEEPGSGGLSSATRTIKRTHDFRNRLVKVENPSAPHYAYEYDNLNRLARSATFSAVPTDVDTPYANRGLLTERFYSQRGRMYETEVAIDPSVSSPDYLESHVWYDEKGREIKSHPHSGPATKFVYDALDRVTDLYLSDAKSDPKAGNSGNHAHADDVTSDTVFEQTSYTYSPEDDLLDLVERRVRSHDSTASGALGATDGVTSWIGHYHDDADRRTHSVNFGTTENLFETGGTAPTWPPASAPSATSGTYNSDDFIVTKTVFNERGLVDRSIDPMGDVTKYLYDDAQRVIATIEAYDDAALDSTQYASDRWQFKDLNDDKDRVTSYVYNGVDDVIRMVAHLPDGTGDDAQVTEYTYGVTAPASPGVDDSLVYNNRLLLKAAYPDETTGDAGSGGTYEVSYSYNAQGELRSVTDQNGVVHAYERDTWGRVTADRIDDFNSSDIDDTVERIEVAYDSFGRVDTIESLDAATGTATVLNGVTYEYTPLWQIEAMHQDMDGVASTDGTGGTETVEYIYGNSKFNSSPIVLGSHNYTRLSNIVYPLDVTASPTVGLRYGSAASVDNMVSLVNGLQAYDGTTNQLLALYEHVGFSRVSEVDYAVPDVQLDRTFSHEGKRNTQGYSSQSAGVYPGWDRFGRVRIHGWVDGDLDEIRTGQSPDPNTAVPGIPPIVEELQAYDRDSIRTGKMDARPGAKRANRDYDFAYDDLDRLTSAKRGSWDDAYSPTTWTATGTATGNSEAWTYDALGNWDELLTDGNFNDDFADTGSGAGYVDLAETRNHNMANELDDIDEDQSVGGVDLSFIYDHAGNRTKKTYVSGGGYDTYIYDAWNRLVKITRTTGGGSPTTSDVAMYEYNGQHHRISETSGDQTREMYYGADWRLLEERVDEPIGTTDREIQHFWGKRYIDDTVMHRVRDDGDTTWSTTKSFYHLTDAMYSTVAIIDGGGNLLESTYFSSYGVPTAYRPGDIDGDGDVDATDIGFFAVSDIADVGTNTNYTVGMDIDRDGDVDAGDYSAWLAQTSKSTLGTGVLSDTAVVDNRTGYDGYRWEPETLLWHVRYRAYDSYAGRWLQRDPMGYVDGLNLNQYCLSSPLTLYDPFGLMTPPITDITTPTIEFIIDVWKRHRDMNRRPELITVTPGDPLGPVYIYRPLIESWDDLQREIENYKRKHGQPPKVCVVSTHATGRGPFSDKWGLRRYILTPGELSPENIATISECETLIIWGCNISDKYLDPIREKIPGVQISCPADGGRCWIYNPGGDEEKRTKDPNYKKPDRRYDGPYGPSWQFR